MTTISIIIMDELIEMFWIWIIWFIVQSSVFSITIRHTTEVGSYLAGLEKRKCYLIDFSKIPLTPSWINELKTRRKSICILLSIMFFILFDVYLVTLLICLLIFIIRNFKDVKNEYEERKRWKEI